MEVPQITTTATATASTGDAMEGTAAAAARMEGTETAAIVMEGTETTEETATGGSVNGDDGSSDDADEAWAEAKRILLSSATKKTGSVKSKSYSVLNAVRTFLEKRHKKKTPPQKYQLTKVHPLTMKKEKVADLFLYTADFDDEGRVKQDEDGFLCIYEFDTKAMDGSKAKSVPFDRWFPEFNAIIAKKLESQLTELYKSSSNLTKNQGKDRLPVQS